MTPRDIHSKNGYTLIEMMIVLFIIVTVTGITLVSFQFLHEKQQTHRFLEQLKKDLYLAQEYAISHHKTIQVLFDSENHQYTVKKTSDSTPIVSRTYGKNITIEKGTVGLSIKYLSSNGNISEPGTLHIKTPQDTYDIVFQIGKGRFYIEKL